VPAFVVIRGNDWSLRDRKDGKTPNEYVAGIVYGAPKVTTVLTGSHFVALCEYGEDANSAKYTFERMGSFSYGASFYLDTDIAFREFGVWVVHGSDTLDTEAQAASLQARGV